jgi:SAM-dependent methyltransferase
VKSEIFHQNNLFFIKYANSLNINQMAFPQFLKDQWEGKCQKATNTYFYSKYFEMMLESIRFQPGTKILDVGCGVGAEVIELSYLGAECTGIDAYNDCVNLLNRIATDFKLNVKGFCGSGCKLPFADASFDVVMSFEFFEHVNNIDQAMAEQIRVLKSGGRLIIEQANLFNPSTLIDLLIKYPRRTQGRNGGLKWLFTKGKIRHNLYDMGWDGRDEDIHTRFWWKKKLQQFPTLYEQKFEPAVEYFPSRTIITKLYRQSYRLLEPLIGNILISATKY